eukprot:1585851-Lingulodinium_polyedra.AAC.1
MKVVATGGLWPWQRRQEAGYPVEAHCRRCGAASETWWHMAWECPANEPLPQHEFLVPRKEQAAR